jgi:hypothetical protein
MVSVKSKAFLNAVKESAQTATRIHGALKLAGRHELASLNDDLDFFEPCKDLAKARNIAWETIRTTSRIQWIILTKFPEFIPSNLPASWLGSGFPNVCFGIIADGSGDFEAKLEALRNVNVRNRMIMIHATQPKTIIRSEHLQKITWVVYCSDTDDLSPALAVKKICQDQKVPFLQLPSESVSEIPDDQQTPWLKHPFGERIKLDQPTLPALLAESITHNASDHAPTQSVTPGNILEIKSKSIDISDQTISHYVAEPGREITPAPETKDDETLSELPAELTEQDFQDFTRLDGVVRRGLNTFIEVGQALAEIRDRELWKVAGHKNWAAYCQVVGGLTKIHANRLIKAAEVAITITQVKPVGFTYDDATPGSEWQIRPLHQLSNPSQQREVWYRAVEQAKGQPTEKTIRSLVSELMAIEEPKVTTKPGKKQALCEKFQQIREHIRTDATKEQIEKLLSELEVLLKLNQPSVN